MSGPWVAIQRNPRSGAGPRRMLVIELIQQLRRHGIRPRLFSNREKMQQRLEAVDAENRPLCIVAAGGDGTVGDVMNRFPDVPITVLPLGTENLFARYLGIRRSGRQVADIIVAGKTRRFDVGEVNGRRFLLMMSCGFDADVVHRTDAARSGHIKKWTYLKPIWDALRKYQYPPMRVYIDESSKAVTARLVVITNVPGYAFRLRIVPAARVDDGRFDVRLFERGSAFQMLRYFYKVVIGRYDSLSDVQALQARQIRIESDVPVPIQMDGDPAGMTPATVTILPSALEVFAPADDAKTG